MYDKKLPLTKIPSEANSTARSQYCRANTPGATYFFTLVTDQRQPIFHYPDPIEILRQAFRTVKQKHPFTIDAIVVLPDHLHCIWTLPPDDADFSKRWRLINSEFTRHIHYNPVNHGLVKAPKDWAYSSFHRAVRWGLYAKDWVAESRIEGFEGVGKE